MSVITDGLDDPCPTCGEVIGDHTMRAFSECNAARAWEKPYISVRPDGAQVAIPGIPPDALIADSVEVKSVAFEGNSLGKVRVRFAGLIHEFASSHSGTLTPVGKVFFMAPPDIMRGYGRLVRDSANGAANAAERG